jgi:uncharacterized short protein YbdD (DUF466 family)
MICCDQWGLKLSKSLKKLSNSARLMVGRGDYEAYAQHMRRNHEDMAILTPAEFFRAREEARFGGGVRRAFRCC